MARSAALQTALTNMKSAFVTNIRDNGAITMAEKGEAISVIFSKLVAITKLQTERRTLRDLADINLDLSTAIGEIDVQ